MIDCYFIPDKKGTSITICANCGEEKFLHTIGEGISTNKTIIQIMNEDKEETSKSINWYKSLTLNQKFALKELCVDICGMKWEDFNILFSPRERLELIYGKLTLEGFKL